MLTIEATQFNWQFRRNLDGVEGIGQQCLQLDDEKGRSLRWKQQHKDARLEWRLQEDYDKSKDLIMIIWRDIFFSKDLFGGRIDCTLMFDWNDDLKKITTRAMSW